jgi:hypothetical protein
MRSAAWNFPVDVLAVNAMGLHLLDDLQFDDLVPLCEAGGLSSFFVRDRAAAARPGNRVPSQPDRDLVAHAVRQAWE